MKEGLQEMAQWIGFAFAMVEASILLVFLTIKKKPVPVIPVGVCSALAVFFVMLHFSTR